MSGLSTPNHDEWDELLEPRRDHIRRLMDKSVKGTATEAEEEELWIALMQDEELFEEYELNIGMVQLCREHKMSRN